jgi:hypothetical protein
MDPPSAFALERPSCEAYKCLRMKEQSEGEKTVSIYN